MISCPPSPPLKRSSSCNIAGLLLLLHPQTILTFHQQIAGTARHSELISGHARVETRVAFGDVGNPEAPVVQDGDSGEQPKNTHAKKKRERVY